MQLQQADKERLGKELFQSLKNARMMPTISGQYPDITYEDAYEIQRYMIREMTAAGYVRSGRKIGLSSKAMQRMVNIDEPDYGSIFHNSRFPNGGVLTVSDYVYPRVEVEFAYKLKHDLTHAAVTHQDVLEATEFIVCALELIDNRADMNGLKIYDSIADNAAFAGYTLGDIPVSPADADMRNVGIVIYKNDEQAATSSGAAVMGDATIGIVWLANKMVELGEPLRAGEYVLAGSVTAAMTIEPGDAFRADFGKFGSVGVRFK